ncbi:MAG TPA: hypothetical protein DDX98_05525 [Bacteroidales bacterium]|jgi:hypothetical protein|nr:hypothetical protein [Bacteroidales bacterium]
MLKYYVLIAFVGIQFSQQNDCKENGEFKKNFFECIDNIETYNYVINTTLENRVTTKMYISSLKDLSQYCEVDFTLIMNYTQKYNSREVYEKEKQVWLDWYNDNRCNNLKWKSN